jgi:hypothetical protein
MLVAHRPTERYETVLCIAFSDAKANIASPGLPDDPAEKVA